MASEIRETVTVSATKGGVTASFSGTDTIDMAGTHAADYSVTTTTSWVALAPANVTAAAHLVVQNLDATNYVELAVDSGGSNIFAKLLAGEFVQIKRIPALPYIRANTAGCLCRVVAYQI